MLAQVKVWFARVPIENLVDRKSAIFMQWLLLFEGFRIPLNKIYLLTFRWTYLDDVFYKRARSGPLAAIIIDFGTDVAMTISAWLGFYLIRNGKFRLAVSIFLSTILICGTVAYTAFGYRATDGNLTFIMVLALSGLMLGRSALWYVYTAEAVILILSVLPARGTDTPHFYDLAVNTFDFLPMRALISFFVITVIFDRSISALRESFHEVDEQRRRLALEIAARERAQDKLFHSQKMDAMGRIASGVAHDMNNIFGIIIGFATERDRISPDVEETDPELAAIAEAMDGIDAAARRGTSVCQKLLAFSRQDASNPTIFDMVYVLRSISPLISKLIPSTVDVRWLLPDIAIYVFFDRGQFELATINLVSNARDAMPHGGTCTLSITREFGYAVLAVEDTGVGMSEIVKAKIFEPFFTTKTMGNGTGLGLSMIDSLVRDLGGWIEVESALGVGSIIRIRLPISKCGQLHGE
jgi:signal transduction histidine kinase